MTRIKPTDPTVKFSVGDWLKILAFCFTIITTMAVPAAVYMGVLQNKVDRNERDIEKKADKQEVDKSLVEIRERLNSVDRQNGEILKRLGEIQQGLGSVQGELKRMNR